MFVHSLILAAAVSAGGEEETRVLELVTVTSQRVANLQPAGSYASTATELRFDPQINLQARGLPEGQADITVRGGLFENTGFRLGAVTVTDPQTGHYAVEIPFDTGMLSTPEVLTDFDNGLNSFNASVATVSYGFVPVSGAGSLSAGAGSDGLLYATVRAGRSSPTERGGSFGTLLSASGSRGDGALENGDHEFKRFSGQLQWTGTDRETNLLFGYHDKFAGWPGMYTGFATLPETDHTKLGLALLDHHWNDQNGWWEVGLAWRQLENDYDFDRRTQESGLPGSFEHETRNLSLGLAGLQHFAGLDWYISGQFTADRLVRSTDLTHGHFNSRSFGALGVAPERSWDLASGATVTARAGLKADFSNRDENALAPMFRLALQRPAAAGIDRWDLSWARTSQLPGYTALNSRPGGLFGGNAKLQRAYADTLKLGYSRETANWTASAALFHRSDDDLVDWTWRRGAPFARQANPVDIDVTGFEGFFSWQSTALEITGGYAWLHKDADYGDEEVDASYYALNFAEHRLTLAAIWQPRDAWELRLDNEYRVHGDNALRSSRDRAWIVAASIAWQAAPSFQLRMVADNLADSDFQEFPGTPPVGRQLSLGLAYDW
mgnify:CR=1 FL=1